MCTIKHTAGKYALTAFLVQDQKEKETPNPGQLFPVIAEQSHVSGNRKINVPLGLRCPQSSVGKRSYGKQLPRLFSSHTPSPRPFQKGDGEETCLFLPTCAGALQIHTLVLHTAAAVTPVTSQYLALDFWDDASQPNFKTLPSLQTA